MIWSILKRQFKSPLLLILIAATVISFVIGEKVQAGVILAMILLSVLLGFVNEYKAEKTMADLSAKISFVATVVRKGIKLSIPVGELIVGDEVLLYPGSIVPADIKLTHANLLEINESMFSGEPVPVHKGHEDKSAYMGTIVVSGTGMGIIKAVGRQTKFGQISASVISEKPETEFQKGMTSYGNLLVRVIVIMGLLIFGVNYLLGRPMLEAGLFALTVAIGLTPELLPVVVTVSLAHGAGRLAKKDVVVKQLVAIEDMGNMEVLCCDKTGTLTEGKLHVVSHQNEQGEEDEKVLYDALVCNAAVVAHKIFGDSIDTAIWEYARNQRHKIPEDIVKVHEQPFDYEHRGMFTVIDEQGKRTYIFKGAPDAVMAGCKPGRWKSSEEKKLDDWYKQGYRIVGVAKKTVTRNEKYTFGDAKEMKLAGWLLFSDLPKAGVRQALDKFEKIGVKLKIITGDNEIVTRKVCGEIDIPCREILTGPDLNKISDEELVKKVWSVDVFARMTPDKKLRVIRALKYGGHTVGYLGDGINDAPALHEADAGISVNTAVDVAKDTAGIVLLHKSLGVIAEGIIEGRRTFANTTKYILMGSSSNFGNMFSMAGASFFLPFLPMLPAQILLANVMYDVSQLSIPTDNVDEETLYKPQKWDVTKIKRYMYVFGPISSIYDFLTFGIMYLIFSARGSYSRQAGSWNLW